MLQQAFAGSLRLLNALNVSKARFDYGGLRACVGAFLQIGHMDGSSSESGQDYLCLLQYAIRMDPYLQ